MLFVTYDPNGLVHDAKLSKVCLSRKLIICARMSSESDIPKTIIGDLASIIGAAEQIGLAGNKKTAFALASGLLDMLWLRVDERPHYIRVVRLGECIESFELSSAPLEVAGAEALFLASKNIAREQHL